MITRAAELAWRAAAGPAYLNIPLEILLEPWDGREIHPVAPPGSTHSAPEEADAVAELLRRAANPVAVTETAGREQGGFEALVAFAEAWHIPVVEPDSAVCGDFPRTHPLHAGSDIGVWMDEADLLLLVNCRFPLLSAEPAPRQSGLHGPRHLPRRRGHHTAHAQGPATGGGRRRRVLPRRAQRRGGRRTYRAGGARLAEGMARTVPRGRQSRRHTTEVGPRD
ncbi:hypothetical protein [Streptomyces avermitilis]|uniref:hypothetical protein n=1 Tax=Streptomyces avermitilis TaxID=33903 RepID=UPI0036AADB54